LERDSPEALSVWAVGVRGLRRVAPCDAHGADGAIEGFRLMRGWRSPCGNCSTNSARAPPLGAIDRSPGRPTVRAFAYAFELSQSSCSWGRCWRTSACGIPETPPTPGSPSPRLSSRTRAKADRQGFASRLQGAAAIGSAMVPGDDVPKRTRTDSRPCAAWGSTRPEKSAPPGGRSLIVRLRSRAAKGAAGWSLPTFSLGNQSVPRMGGDGIEPPTSCW
jgi:hypothetical protein